MEEGKGFPILNAPLSVDIRIAREAYHEYVVRYGNTQSLERLAERGGFGIEELLLLLYQRIERLKAAQCE